MTKTTTQEETKAVPPVGASPVLLLLTGGALVLIGAALGAAFVSLTMKQHPDYQHFEYHGSGASEHHGAVSFPFAYNSSLPQRHRSLKNAYKPEKKKGGGGKDKGGDDDQCWNGCAAPIVSFFDIPDDVVERNASDPALLLFHVSDRQQWRKAWRIATTTAANQIRVYEEEEDREFKLNLATNTAWTEILDDGFIKYGGIWVVGKQRWKYCIECPPGYMQRSYCYVYITNLEARFLGFEEALSN